MSGPHLDPTDRQSLPEPPGMDPRARDTARERLREETGRAAGRGAARWTVPVLVAAAVGVVAVVVASVLPPTPPDDAARPTPSPTPGSVVGVGRSEALSLCRSRTTARRPDARIVASSGTRDGGLVAVSTNEATWAICVVHDDQATVLRSGLLPAAIGFTDVPDYTVTSDLVAASADRRVVAFVAGGRVLAGHFAATYTFPDGHVEKARLLTDEAGQSWWYVDYTPRTGPLTVPGLSRFLPAPLEVDVTTGGATRHREYRLPPPRCSDPREC